MLDSMSLKILRYIKAHPQANLSELKAKFSDNCEPNVRYLCSEQYINNELKGYLGIISAPVYKNIYTILPKGTAYLEELPKNRFLKIYPLIVSTIAVVISLIALLRSFGII